MKLSLRSRTSARLNNARGMTLIEIMVVIAILGVLATAIGVGVVNYLKKGKADAARLHLDKVAEAITAYFASEGEWPNSINDITSGNNALLKEKDLKDPWKSELVYRYPASSGDADFDLCSKGPDKREGTQDDICRE